MKQKINLPKVFNFRPLFYAFVGALFGASMANRIFNLNLIYIILVLLCFALLGIGGIFYKKWLPFVLIFASFWVGIGGYFLSEKIFLGDPIYGEQEVVGRVSDNITEKEGYYNLILDDCYVGGKTVSGVSLYVYKDDSLQIKNGDVLSFSAHVDQVKLWELGSFNSYYVRNGVNYTSSVSSSEIVLTEGYLKFDEKIRGAIKNNLFRFMSDENAGLSYAFLTGDKSYVDGEIKSDFSGAGVMHLLTISGLHISFLVFALSWLMKKLKASKYVNLVVVFVFVLLYCFVCGWAPSVVRASIMALVLLLAPIFGKEYDNLTSLGVAGLILLAINPLYALDLGFLMSFGCVFSIFCLQKPVEKILKKIFPDYFARALSVSFSAQVGITPFLVGFSGEINILVLIANIIIIPVFTLVFILTFVCTILSFIPYFGYLLKLPHYLIFGVEYLTSFFAGTTLKISVGKMDPVISAIYFLIIFGASYFFMVSRKIKSLVLSGMIFVVSIYGLLIHFNKLNLGDDIFILTKYDQTSFVLTDQAGDVIFVGNEFGSTVQQWLKDNRFDKIDYVICLNKKKIKDDTVAGFIDFEVKQVYSPFEMHENIVNTQILEGNTSYFAGDYMFEFVEHNEEFFGIKIKYKNFDIFFAREDKLSYNNSEYMKTEISQKDFDLAFLGKRGDCCAYFGSSLTFGRNFDENLNYSYQRDGNLKISLLDNILIRNIDA